MLPFSTFIKLCRATWSLTARVAASPPGDATYVQFVVLEALSPLGPMNQVTLAQKILRSSASVNVVVDNLDQRGRWSAAGRPRTGATGRSARRSAATS